MSRGGNRKGTPKQAEKKAKESIKTTGKSKVKKSIFAEDEKEANDFDFVSDDEVRPAKSAVKEVPKKQDKTKKNAKAKAVEEAPEDKDNDADDDDQMKIDKPIALTKKARHKALFGAEDKNVADELIQQLSQEGKKEKKQREKEKKEEEKREKAKQVVPRLRKFKAPAAHLDILRKGKELAKPTREYVKRDDSSELSASVSSNKDDTPLYHSHRIRTDKYLNREQCIEFIQSIKDEIDLVDQGKIENTRWKMFKDPSKRKQMDFMIMSKSNIWGDLRDDEREFIQDELERLYPDKRPNYVENVLCYFVYYKVMDNYYKLGLSQDEYLARVFEFDKSKDGQATMMRPAGMRLTVVDTKNGAAAPKFLKKKGDASPPKPQLTAAAAPPSPSRGAKTRPDTASQDSARGQKRAHSPEPRPARDAKRPAPAPETAPAAPSGKSKRNDGNTLTVPDSPNPRATRSRNGTSPQPPGSPKARVRTI